MPADGNTQQARQKLPLCTIISFFMTARTQLPSQIIFDMTETSTCNMFI